MNKLLPKLNELPEFKVDADTQETKNTEPEVIDVEAVEVEVLEVVNKKTNANKEDSKKKELIEWDDVNSFIKAMEFAGQEVFLKLKKVIPKKVFVAIFIFIFVGISVIAGLVLLKGYQEKLMPKKDNSPQIITELRESNSDLEDEILKYQFQKKITELQHNQEIVDLKNEHAKSDAEKDKRISELEHKLTEFEEENDKNSSS